MAYADAVIYVTLGYYLSWQPSEIDEMDYETLVKCMQIVSAMIGEGISKQDMELFKGKFRP